MSAARLAPQPLLRLVVTPVPHSTGEIGVTRVGDVLMVVHNQATFDALPFALSELSEPSFLVKELAYGAKGMRVQFCCTPTNLPQQPPPGGAL